MASTNPADGIRNNLIMLLQSPAAQQIDFYLDRFHVDGPGFIFVTLALVSKPIHGHGLGIHVGGLAHGTEAEYHPDTNTYLIPSAGYGTTPFQRMTLIHESIHAMRDCLGQRFLTTTGPIATRALSDEAAAYLGGALFNIFDTTPAGAVPTTPSFATGTDVYGVAYRLALKVRTQMGYAVGPQDAKDLRDAVARQYTVLRNNPRLNYGNNGVRL